VSPRWLVSGWAAALWSSFWHSVPPIGAPAGQAHGFWLLMVPSPSCDCHLDGKVSSGDISFLLVTLRGRVGHGTLSPH
jgi:hypothetical protein